MNSAGLRSKLKSFEFILNDLQVSLFFIQETKYINNVKINFDGSSNYDIYQLNRKNKCGGGLAIGARKEFNSSHSYTNRSSRFKNQMPEWVWPPKL